MAIPEQRQIAPGDVIRRGVVERAEANDDSRSILFIASDESLDRVGDRIMADGWELEEYNKNPVVLWSHDARQPPIGTGEVYVEGDKLMARATFPDEKTDRFGARIYRLLKAGFLNAVSVGFRPLDFNYRFEEDAFTGIDFLRQELLEFSVVNIPANSNAVAVARSLDFSTADLERVFGAPADVPAKRARQRRELEVLALRSMR